ncbi:MAG: hypothetical protein H7070_07465 [Saprospiraceae bacterium]|nr:hypothetical protein [Pyrinomonadaceae bacterium]
MATTITQTENPGTNETILRIEGEMLLADAMLLEKIAVGIQSETGSAIAIDLADLDFLDSESAAVLKRLSDKNGFAIRGMEIFLQTAINDAERTAT